MAMNMYRLHYPAGFIGNENDTEDIQADEMRPIWNNTAIEFIRNQVDEKGEKVGELHIKIVPFNNLCGISPMITELLPTLQTAQVGEMGGALPQIADPARMFDPQAIGMGVARVGAAAGIAPAPLGGTNPADLDWGDEPERPF